MAAGLDSIPKVTTFAVIYNYKGLAGRAMHMRLCIIIILAAQCVLSQTIIGLDNNNVTKY